MATEQQRRQRLRAAIISSASRKKLLLTEQAVIAIVDRASGHVQRRTLNESARDNDVSVAVAEVDKLTENLKAFKSDGSFTSIDFRNFVARGVNCFYPFCKPEK